MYPYNPIGDAVSQADRQFADWDFSSGTSGLQALVDWLPVAASGPFMNGDKSTINLGLAMLEHGIEYHGDGEGGALCRLPHHLRRATDLVDANGVINADARVDHRILELAAERAIRHTRTNYPPGVIAGDASVRLWVTPFTPTIGVGDDVIQPYDIRSCGEVFSGEEMFHYLQVYTYR